MKINVHIERLVLDGLPVGSRDGDLTAKAMRAELARLFAQRAIPASLRSGAAVPGLRADIVQFGGPLASQPFGQQIAQAVHGIIAK